MIFSSGICFTRPPAQLAWTAGSLLIFAMMAFPTDGNGRQCDLSDRGQITRWLTWEYNSMNAHDVSLIRIFQPEPANEPTIRDLYEQVMIPQLERLERAEGTFSDYRTSLTKWESYWQSGAASPPDDLSGGDGLASIEPPASRVTRRQLQAFADWYREYGKDGKPAAAVTVNRRVGLLVAILDAAADDDDCEYDDSPKAPKRLPETTNKRKVILTVEHVNAIYRACEVADWPRYRVDGGALDAAAADYWRALIVCLFNYGPRLQDFVAYSCQKTPLQWRSESSGVVLDPESPASEATSEHGWLWFTPTKTKAVKGQPLVLPMPAVVRAHLDLIRGDGVGPVFPFPRNKVRFTATRKAIFEAAGVQPKAALCQGRDHYLPKDFRKTCLTYHQRQNRGIGPFVTGHAARGSDRVIIADRHYDNAELALADHFPKFIQPSAFEAVFERENSLEHGADSDGC